MEARKGLDLFFAPRSVAVVGATANKTKGGYSIIANMLESFDGPVYAVNPGRTEINGVKCHASLRDLAGKVELAIVFVPAARVPAVLEDAVAAGVRAAVIESGGFAETGEEGRLRQRRLLGLARSYGLRLIGPNCTGLVNTEPLIFTPFIRFPDLRTRLQKGNLGIVAQSGMMAAGFMMQYLMTGFFKVSKACAIGNKMDVDEVEVLDYLAGDPNTEAVVAYLESIADGGAFVEVARRMAGEKPLVVLKGGRYEESARAALSHTASIAGSDEVIDGALRQAGALRVHDFQDLMDLGKAFSLNPRPFRPASPEGNRIAVVTVSGGGGVVTSDLARDGGLSVPPLREETLEKLKLVFPPWMAPHNPVDIWPAIEQKGFDAFSVSVGAVLADPGIDGVILLTFASRIIGAFPYEELGEGMRRANKPLVSWVFGDARFFDAYREGMESIGAPVYTTVRSCAKALSAYLHFARWARRKG